ncbi:MULTISPECIES: Crp/Fnr family transcriptional regulator [Chryseobacterium]|uniref:CRP-like cAMP-binding protein n=1 Tax=Chryseobacterium camelliae TaxID=1265445 RepID=A0ABU0TG62_9FLAO|nr:MULTISPECIES: Crp/Fnr family transcriptional regulator [Chryseobacterium]MDT3406182.1 CRP-like cAMP-binding protein [Pseudacidovorax intermedius]MDQ1096017.1 CRP-like cAMP-binding protein [Chryseobacterium camelliae]MDQ1099953.1 CRP-like cAMP-binding protein [Chryseobacterium sp. SORGH_AS_1048]MDR6087298.1 CRP-like cAMP-binding protein [Chryseobacterium sp. SORGH_AS_0909]MDR6131673.1 CRP-like cAMP-binding protein [Chryseobacterium sp. SORGH_AS_1175]
MDIEEILDRIYSLPQASKIRLKQAVTEVSYPKNFILMEGSKVIPYVYFIKKGMVRAYAAAEDRDITFWFGKEGEPVVSMKSYVEKRPGYEYIELLEDCILYRIETESLTDLYQEDIHIANWGRRFAEKELVKTEELIISRQFKTAAECYRDLIRDKPDLLQRVQLGHIASYLGITQVTLSRIRAEMK